MHDPVVRSAIEARLEALLKKVNAGLVEYERLAMIVVVREPWSVENGMLTPTLKIKRARIEAAIGKFPSAALNSPEQLLLFLP